ncbi:MAG: hypothetical protein GXO20_04790 [Thermodesulfobacteria bacterium]|nr:hypothetical protein [Thermodesulfobacteriota bacterium]
MKKFWGALLAVILWSGISLAAESQKAQKPCPCPDCPKKGQMMMSPEEWKKWHKDIPMPEEMRKHYEETQEHREKMQEQGESEDTIKGHHEEMKKYHERYHKEGH